MRKIEKGNCIVSLNYSAILGNILTACICQRPDVANWKGIISPQLAERVEKLTQPKGVICLVLEYNIKPDEEREQIIMNPEGTFIELTLNSQTDEILDWKAILSDMLIEYIEEERTKLKTDALRLELQYENNI